MIDLPEGTIASPASVRCRATWRFSIGTNRIPSRPTASSVSLSVASWVSCGTISTLAGELFDEDEDEGLLQPIIATAISHAKRNRIKTGLVSQSGQGRMRVVFIEPYCNSRHRCVRGLAGLLRK